MLEIPKPENIIQPIPAEDIFRSPGGYEGQVRNALEDGRLKIEIVDPEQEDIEFTVSETLPDDAEVGPVDEYVQSLTPQRARRLEESLKEEVVRHEFNSRSWQLSRPIQEERTSGGEVSQIFEIKVGDRAIPLINFSGSTITPEHLESILSGLRKISVATDGRGLAELQCLVVRSSEKMKSKSETEPERKPMGAAYSQEGVVEINEAILQDNPEIEGGFDLSDRYGSEESENISALEVVLTHEVGHLVDLAGTYKGEAERYEKALGWVNVATHHVDDYGNEYHANTRNATQRGRMVTDDYGNQTEQPSMGIRSIPHEIDVPTEEGDEKVKTMELLGKTGLALSDVKPVTSYGSWRTGREDFPEAFVPYVLDGPEAAGIDPVRRQAMQNQLRDLDSQVESGEITVASVPMHEFDSVGLRPRVVRIGLRLTEPLV